MKKKILMLLALLTPTIVNASDFIACGNDKKIPVVITTIISTLFVIIRIIIPLIFVITGMISFFKATIANKVEEDLKKAKDKLINNIIAAVIIFFIISIVNFVISLAAGKNNSITSCINCMIHPNKCQKIEENIDKLCPGLISDQANYDENCNYIGDQKERVDYSTGKNGIQEYTDTKTGNNGNRTLRDNPNAKEGEYFVKGTYQDYSYYLYTPKQIDSDKAALIVYLHGSGGQGSSAAPLRADGGGAFFHEIEENKKEYNAYILLLQTPRYEWIPNNIAMHIINEVIQNNNIDEKRISLWGYSMGANATTAIIHANPNFFASSVILSSQVDLNQVNNVKNSYSTTPTYFLHGADDPYKYGSETLYNTLNGSGYKVYRKVYPNHDHAFLPNTVLEDTELDQNYKTIMDWVLDQRRTD